MYKRPDQKSPLELLNLFGSLCSIIALIIVLCAELHLRKTLVIVFALVVTLGLTGWIFVGSYTLYKDTAENIFKYGTPITLKLFLGVVSIIIGLILLVYVYKMSFVLTDWLVGIIAETLESLTSQ